MKTKALIIAYYWPPSGGPGVQRWLKLSNYLLENNIKPIIYTPENPRYPFLDYSFLDDINSEIEVIKAPIFEPFSFFNKIVNKIRRGGVPNYKDQSLIEKFLIYIRGNFLIPDSRIFWVKPSTKFLSKYLLENKIDTVITSGPPHSLHLIGLNLKLKLNITWFADFRDPWTKINYHKKLKLNAYAKRKHLKLEKNVINSCDRIIVTSKKLLNYYNKITNKPISLIYNGFDYNKKELSLDRKFSITHIGSLLPERNPEILWRVLGDISSQNNNMKKDLQINFIGNVDDNIRELICLNNLENNTIQHNYIDYKDTIPYLIKSQILLLVEADDSESSYVIPAKIFEYVNSGRPIIAIGPEGSEIKQIINNTKSGKYFLYDQYDDLFKYIENCYNLYKIGKLDIQPLNIDQYHRKSLAKKIADIILKKAD